MEARTAAGEHATLVTPAAVDAPDLRLFVFALFFIFGGITSLNDILVPKLKDLFALSNAQSMLVQSAFFAAYFVFSVPAAAIVQRIGYLRAASVGLLTMTAGCLLFVPASARASYGLFLAALFVVATGITIVQVVTNPLISLLGRASTAHSRLTFAQAFNSLGTTVFPYFGSLIILGGAAQLDPGKLSGAALRVFRAHETQRIEITYLALAAVLVAVAVLVWLRRKRLSMHPAPPLALRRWLELLRQPRFAYGAACIFCYVGAEVSIGSMLVKYLMLPGTLGLAAEAAGKHVPYYWGGAMVGRFIGAGILRRLSPGKVLAVTASVALALVVLSAQSHGALAADALLAVGLFNSIMFPTIFSLASEGLGVRAAEGSGIICVAIVGGAVLPWLTGQVADLAHDSLRTALIVPALGYAAIVGFGIYARRPVAHALDLG